MEDKTQSNKIIFYFTVPIIMLIAVCSGIGVASPASIYSKETSDWLLQCIGQDYSNLFCTLPVLLVSAFFVRKGSRIAKIIWAGAIITNIYSFILYCFCVHFNFLFYFYCIVLGLSLYALIYFGIKNSNENFKGWFSESTRTKPLGIFLLVITALFYFTWLSQSLPAVLTNTVPKAIEADALFTNPVYVLDFSFYLPLIVLSAVMLLKRKSTGYFLAPMMLVFAIITNINIISLTVVTMLHTSSDSIPMIVIFSVFTVVCVLFLVLFLRNIKPD